MQLVTLATCTILFLLYTFDLLLRYRKFKVFSQRNGCQPPPYQPASRLHKLRLVSNKYQQIFEDYYASKYAKYGKTHAITDSFGFPKAIHSIDPVNLHAVLVDSREDWLVFKNRRNALKPFAQGGVLTTDGEEWHQNRKFLFRRINNRQAKDTTFLEQDVGLFFQAIDIRATESEAVETNVSTFVHRMMLDISSRLLFGVSTELQLHGINEARGTRASSNDREWNAMAESYQDNWNTLRDCITLRTALGSKYWMADGPKYRRACARFRGFADMFIDRTKRGATRSDSLEASKSKSLYHELISELDDPDKVREILLELIMASQNITGSSLEWAIAELASSPSVYSRLREEVLATCGPGQSVQSRNAMTWDALQSCQTLQNIIKETLRCHPVIPTMSRTAGKDTVLPRGGGENGDEPVAVPRGATLTSNIYLLHRQEELWGSDAEQWNPDRWIGRKVGPEYLPFSSGPRICMGRQVSLTQLSYVIARIAQHVEEIRPAGGANNLAYEYRSILSPKYGVHVVLSKTEEAS